MLFSGVIAIAIAPSIPYIRLPAQQPLCCPRFTSLQGLRRSKLALEELQSLDYDWELTGFDSREVDLLSRNLPEDERLDEVLPFGEVATTRLGEMWRLGRHCVLCGDATDPKAVERLLNGHLPLLMVTDPPYGVELDTEWRDRRHLNQCGPAEPSYLKRRIEGHRQTSISGESPRPRRRVLPGRMKKRYPRGRVFLRGGCWGVFYRCC